MAFCRKAIYVILFLMVIVLVGAEPGKANIEPEQSTGSISDTHKTCNDCVKRNSKSYLPPGFDNQKNNILPSINADTTNTIMSLDYTYYLYQGWDYMDEEQYYEAIIQFNAAIDLDATKPDAYYGRGCCYNLLGQFDLGITDFNQAIFLAPQWARPYYGRGRAYYEKGQYADAIRDLTTAANLDSYWPDPLHWRGWIYYDLNKYTDAINDFTAAITLAPTWADPYNGRAWCYFEQGQYDLAIADFTTVTTLDSQWANPYYGRGRAYYEKGQYYDAINDFTTAANMDSYWPEPRHWRGWAYYDLNNYTEAINQFTAAITLAPTWADPYVGRGRSYEQTYNYTGAYNDYSTAIQYAPDWYYPYVRKGFLSLINEHYGEAIALLSQSIELNNRNGTAYVVRGWVHYYNNELEKALADVRNAAALNPDTVNLSRIEAVVMFFKQLNLEPCNSPTTFFTDVPQQFWASGMIYACVKSGLIVGDSDGSFHPEKYISRAQLAVLLCRGFNIPTYPPESPTFNDISGHWAKGGIEAVAHANLMEGFSDNTFRPNDYVTVADAIVAFSRLKNISSLCMAQFTVGNPVFYRYGQPYTADVGPLSVNGNILVPLRFISESLGLLVIWDGDNQQMTFSNANISITMQVGSPIMHVNNLEVDMGVCPVLYNDRTYAPIKYMAQACGNRIEQVGDTIKIFEGGGTPYATVTITNNALIDGYKNNNYSINLSAVGGTPPHCWRICEGSLPGGLSLSTDGVISGVANVGGAFSFKVECKDSGDPRIITTKELSINVAEDTDQCFIATAAFGSKFEPSVILLRHFRDDYLLKTFWGRSIVAFYYHNSPPIAVKIADNNGLKMLTRLILLPFITVVYTIYHPFEALLVIVFLLLFCFWLKQKRLARLTN